ncbi:MAG: hypothetical protein GF383_14190 [Candidatus Lokiarchaeota archaeon]|nr:hypothetical protein [Candidatus Lokiarchaeota archaeon]MBD3342507.1 hypothetical protein [Candidatus Lokiarchaeota archaeon]
MENIQEEKIEIPIEEDNINLKASIYHSQNTPLNAPLLINCPGLLDNRESYFVNYYTEKFAYAGYYVLAYDYRAHGETAKQTGKNWLKQIYEIFSDLKHVITWSVNNLSDRIFDNKIALFGRSIGAAIILTQGFIDERAQKLIALCARYDYHKIGIKFPEDVIKFISPKYYLKDIPSNNSRILIAHCKDDPRIPFENFSEIKKHLGLKASNAIEYETGGHSFKGHRDDIFQISLDFLKSL